MFARSAARGAAVLYSANSAARYSIAAKCAAPMIKDDIQIFAVCRYATCCDCVMLFMKCIIFVKLIIP